MATNQVLIRETGTPKQIVFRDSTDYGTAPATAANNIETSDVTRVQLDMTSVANTAARQSTKADLGANRATEYAVKACIELAATPTAGKIIRAYWAPSHNATAGTGNAAGISGADSAYTGDNSNLADAVKQLIFIGSFVCTDLATTSAQIAEMGTLAPSARYGSLVLVNESGAAIHSDANEIAVTLTPIIIDIQAAA